MPVGGYSQLVALTVPVGGSGAEGLGRWRAAWPGGEAGRCRWAGPRARWCVVPWESPNSIDIYTCHGHWVGRWAGVAPGYQRIYISDLVESMGDRAVARVGVSGP